MRKTKNLKSVDKKIINSKNNDDKISQGINILNNYKEKLFENREKRIGKTLNEAIEEYELEQNSGNNKGLKRVVFLILISFIVILIYLFFYYGPIVGISVYRDEGITEEKRIDIVTTDNDIYKMYDNEFLIYSNSKLSTYNGNAKKTWEYSFSEQFNPNIYVQGKYMVVANNSTGTIFLFENKQEILDKKIDGTIQNIYLDSSGNMAIEYSTSGYKKVIGVFSKGGKNLYNAYLSAGSIIDIELLENAKKLLIFQSSTTSFKVGTKVIVVDGTKTENNTTEISKLDDNYIYDLTIQGQNIIIVLDSGVIKLNIDTGEKTDIKKFDSAQFMFIGLSSNYYSSIEKKLDSNDDNYLFQNNRFDNTIIGSVQIENSPKMMQNTSFLSYIVYQNKLQVINKWGIEVKNISIDVPPKDIVVFGDQKSIALIYTNKVYIVNI